ncbi:MAG: battenin CLN3 protein [Tremellales sp. Tagirdzhanova-0007]|nr:MAG: battenin CLN3 protein [Tremellales sp. Tagirdzhanova-0007]
MEALPLHPFPNPMSPSSHEPGHSRRSSDQDDAPSEVYDADQEDLEADEDETFAAARGRPRPEHEYASIRLFVAFLIFGLLNNVLYVIILSAALDLVPSTTPKGVVAFFNIFPALLTKVGWPLLSNGQIRYGRRLGFCTCCSWFGIIIIALSTSLYLRLLGISLASLSSGLGELTFLQLTTTLPTSSTSRTALGAWSSGTGFAGIAGAGIWWLLRSLGVKVGLGISSLLPLFFPITYLFLLPPFSQLQDTQPYQSLPTSSVEPSANTSLHPTVSLLPTNSAGSKGKNVEIRLTTAEKIQLLRPLLVRYMLPLCAVYIEEYVINSGVAPTLVFPLPNSGLWSTVFKSPRDYYPFWSLTYQTFVFLSRSSISLGLPPVPRRFLPLPSIVQGLVLSLLTLQSSLFIFSSPAFTPPRLPPAQGFDRTISVVFILMCLEGLCGGSAYVNTFYHVGREGADLDERAEDIKTKMEKEFRIGSVGAADSCGILFASLISMPLEIKLCDSQVARGRTTCRTI